MANTLTNLAGDIYTAADVVGRELSGYIPSVTMNADSARAAKDDNVRAAFTAASTVNDIAESMTVPQGDDQTVTASTLTLNKSRAVQIPYTGEDVLHLNNGAGYETVLGDQIAQAMRALTNEMETDLAAVAQSGAGATDAGTDGTTPFASDLEVLAVARKNLVDNGCPTDDISAVIDTSAGANLRQIANLLNANQAGTTAIRDQGILIPVFGVNVRESGKITGGDGACFHRSAIELAVRAPALPSGGDQADDALVIQDPHSGLVFEVRTYRGYRKAMIEVGATWGVKAWKGDFIAKILG